VPKKNLRKGIIFPRGGCGNHLRWLLSLDDKCNYADIFNIDIDNTVNAKLEFICREVYNSERNQKNWLKSEYLHREKLDSFMQILHTHDWPTYDYDKLLILDFDNEKSCLAHYLNVHPTLGGRPVQQYIDDFNAFKSSVQGNDWREFYQGIKEENWPWYDSAKEFYETAPTTVIAEAVEVHNLVKHVRPVPDEYCVVNAESLHNIDLNKDLYTKCTEYFEFEEHYESAAEVHKLYWNCRKRKE